MHGEVEGCMLMRWIFSRFRYTRFSHFKTKMSYKEMHRRCFCLSHGCGGIMSSSKTVHRHAKEDLERITKNIGQENTYDFVRIHHDEDMYRTNIS